MQTELPRPDWDNLAGGSIEADWLADRDRKVNLILSLSSDVLLTARNLNQENAVFTPTADILLTYPFAIEWYICLAGFALNTLRNISESPADYGVTLRLSTIRNRLRSGQPIDDDEAAAIANWLSDQIEGLWPEEHRSADRAMVVVSAILGGRALGQGQNAGGSAAVTLLKEALATYAQTKNLTLESLWSGQWQSDTPDYPPLLADSLRIDERLICEFFTGGDTPDVVFRLDGSSRPLAVGEVKGRKDTSNVWESWMPQVVDHMRTWTREYRQSWRLFFGTLITSAMIEGESTRGTERRGLRSLNEEGNLDAVFNLAKLAQGDAHAVASFETLLSILVRG